MKLLLVATLSLICQLVSGVSQCGKSEANTRIVGGQESKRLAWPWQAALTIVKSTHQMSCGGTLIDSRHIITAAHCFEGTTRGLRTVKVLLGEHDMRKAEGSELLIETKNVRIHPQYNKQSQVNDIAIINLDKDLDLDGKHKQLAPICLPEKSRQVEKKKCVATGWGDTSDHGHGSKVLKQVTQPWLDEGTCRKVWSTKYDQKKMLCAGVMKGGEDSCQGDSGGPLQCPMSNGVWVLEGVISFGDGCAKPNRPGIYTRVESYLDWINKNK